MKVKDYIDKGVYQNKAILTEAPCTTWDIVRKKFVTHKDYLDIIPTGDGNFKASIDNNRMVIVRTYTKLSNDLVKKINESPDGIAVYETDNDHYRFAFIPGVNYI